MKNNAKVIDLVEQGIECEYLDYKATQYDKEKHPELLKDIMAMANSSYSGPKYIIVGIKLLPNGVKEVVGVNKDGLIDSSIYEELVLNNIEPEINFRYIPVKYEDKLLGVFELEGNEAKPYILMKDYGKLKKGLCFIRKGTHQDVASRGDYDTFYSQRESFNIYILEGFLCVTDGNRVCGQLKVSIRNLTSNPVTLDYGVLYIHESLGNMCSQHRVFGFDKFVGADFTLPLSPKSELTGHLFLGFESSDCLCLGLNVYGTTEETFKFRLILVDTLGNEYIAKEDGCAVFAKGNVLWKVNKMHNYKA